MTHKNRPRKIFTVFCELRQELGEQYPAHEVLRVAYQMVEIIEGRGDFVRFRMAGGRIAFDQLPVDEAMADGGWRILSNAPFDALERTDENIGSPFAQHGQQLSHLDLAA